MNRRTGQIKKRGDRRWLVSVFLGRDLDTGQRHYKAKTVSGTKRDAERKLAEMLHQRNTNTLPAEPAKMSLNAYLDRWLETSAKPRVGPRTYEGYVYLLDKYVRPTIGTRRLTAITPLEVQEFYQRMLEQGHSADAVRRTHGVLRPAFKQSVRWRLRETNPTADVDVPRWRRREAKALSPEQAIRFRVAAAEHPMGLLFTLMLATGMRPGEALGIRWQDVDLDARTVRVRQALVRLNKKTAGGEAPGSRWSFERPKTPKSRRSIPIPAGLVRELAEHRRRQAAARLRRGPAWQDHDLVFSGRLGQPLDWQNVSQRAFKKILEAADLPQDLSPYCLRHTCASLLLAAGEPSKVIAERLGHSTTAITDDVYSHVLPGMQERATERLEALLYGNV